MDHDHIEQFVTHYIKRGHLLDATCVSFHYYNINGVNVRHGFFIIIIS